MKKVCAKVAVFTTCSLIPLLVPQVAFAQTAEEAAAAEGSDEIVVTATRDGSTLRSAPLSINVATGDQLEKLRILDVKDIQQLAPGLELSNNSGRNNTATLRGLSFDPDQGTTPSVQVFLNEVPTDAQAAFTAIYDIKQIEVLRGPQGVLRGQGAPAGSMLIATRRPKFDAPEGYAQATATERGGFNIQGGVSLPFSEQFAVRVAMLADGNRINHVRNITRGGERSQSRTVSGRITLGYRPTEGVEAFLTYQHLEAENNVFQQVVGTGNTPVGLYSELFGRPRIFVTGSFLPDTTLRSGPALTASDYASVTDGVYNVELNQDLLNFNLNWDLGPATAAFIASRQRDTIDTLRDQDLGNALPGIIRDSRVHVPFEVDTQELRLASNNREGFGWTVGVYHSRQKGLVTNDSTNDVFLYNVAPNAQVRPICPLPPLPTAPGCPNPTTVQGTFSTLLRPNALPLATFVNVPLDIDLWSFNANLRYSSGPFKIEGGVRYTIRENSQTTQVKLVGFRNQDYTEVIPAAFRHSKVKPWTGGVNISYEVSDNTNVYATYGHAFRSPSTGVSTPIGITGDLLRTGSETTDAFEVGIKGSLLDRRLRYSVAAFHQKFDGFIRRFNDIFWQSNIDPSGSGTFAFNYGGDAKVKGVEAELNGRIIDNWDFGLSAAYAHARYSNARLPCNDYAGTGVPNQTGTPLVQGFNAITNSPNVSYCLSNGRLAEAPDFSLSFNTEIRFPVGELTPFVRALLTHRPGYFSDQSNFQYQSRQLLNLFVGLRGPDGAWSFDLFARNLLDQHRVSNISLGTQTISGRIRGVFDSGYRTVNTMNPREFGASVSFKF